MADPKDGALNLAYAALSTVQDWQWGKREPDLRDDQLLSAETVRPMISDALAAIKALRGDSPKQVVADGDSND